MLGLGLVLLQRPRIGCAEALKSRGKGLEKEGGEGLEKSGAVSGTYFHLKRY